MKIELFKTLEGAGWYGNIPWQGDDMPDSALETKYYEINEMWEALKHTEFVDPINKLCDTLFDYGDIDYFDASNCIKLKSWLENRLKQPTTACQLEFYTDLLDFATRAIELNTGVVLEF